RNSVAGGDGSRQRPNTCGRSQGNLGGPSDTDVSAAGRSCGGVSVSRKRRCAGHQRAGPRGEPRRGDELNGLNIASTGILSVLQSLPQSWNDRATINNPLIGS